MKYFGKVVTIAAVAISFGFLAAPKASADTILMSTPNTVIDTTTEFSAPMWVSQPAVVIDNPAPVIRTTPVVMSPTVVAPTVIRERDNHLLHVGLPGLVNFSLF
jgi:hypothetical protein